MIMDSLYFARNIQVEFCFQALANIAGLLRLCIANHYRNGVLLQYPTEYEEGYDDYQDYHPYMDLHQWKKLPSGDIYISGTIKLLKL